MWPDPIPHHYLTVQNLHDNPDMDYETMRAEFHKMIDLCGNLTSDIGWMDMILQFDDEGMLSRAINILNNNGLRWKSRDKTFKAKVV